MGAAHGRAMDGTGRGPWTPWADKVRGRQSMAASHLPPVLHHDHRTSNILRDRHRLEAILGANGGTTVTLNCN